MKRIFTLLTFCFLAAPCAVFAQTDIPLKFVRVLPKNLYAARTAVLIGYTANAETTSEDDARIINQYSAQLLADKQTLGLQMLHFADKNVLLQPAKKRALLRQYDSLQIENLLFLDITDIKGQGAQGSYVFTHTAFNRQANLITANQRAFVLQAESYENLVRDFTYLTQQYGSGYFIKGKESAPLKPALDQEPTQAISPANSQTTKINAKPLAYPLISLTAEDLQRGKANTAINFYYYLGANQQEKKAGFFGQHLRKDVQASPGAMHELDKYMNYKIAYLAERAVFVTSVILYANEILQDDGRDYFNDRQKVYLGIAAGSLLLHVLIARNTNQHMRRAIDEYNAFATIKNNSGFHRLKPSGLGFGAIYDRKVLPGISLQWALR